MPDTRAKAYRDIIRPLTPEEKCDHGWAGWCGGELRTRIDEDVPIEDVLYWLAKEVREVRDSLAIKDDTATHYRIIGFGYTPQGYANTPNGPSIWFFSIEGDRIRT
jgi:hypothetical protein